MFASLLEWNGEVAAGDAIVGVGTLALAFFTWWLARQTKADVDASRDSIAVSREAVEAADMPYVIPAPTEIGHGSEPGIIIEQAGSEYWLAVRLWNVGRGPAIVIDVGLTIEGADLPYPIRAFPVAAEQVHDLKVPLRYAFVPTRDVERRGVLTVVYSHASGAYYETSCDMVIRYRELECVSYARSPLTRVATPLRASS